jgi:hypothetical protein
MANETTETQNTPPVVGEGISRSEAAYKRLRAEIDALPEETVAVINLDIPAIVQTGLGVLPEVRKFEDEVKQLPSFDVSAFEKLEDYAYALLHLQTLYMAASAPPEALGDLVARAIAARELLLADIPGFVAHGHLSLRGPNELDKSLGHRGIAMDVGRLARVVIEAWPKLQGKTSLTFEKLVEFEALRDQIVAALGLKEQGEELEVEVTAQRERSYTLFVRAYDEVRRAISFLRWKQGDVDEITPSLYSGKAGRRRTEVPSPTPATPATPATPGAPAATSAPSTAAPATGVAAQSAPIPVGHPGSDPFGP